MLDAGLEVRLLMLKPRPLKQRFLILQVLTAPKPPVTNYRKLVTFKTQKPHEKTTNSLKRIEEYKTKKPTEDNQPSVHTPTISTVPYPLQHSQTGRKPVQSRHPIQAIPLINCTGPTLHTAESHRKIYDPARQRNSHGPSTPKVNKERNKCDK
jgi:hypothetical protein